MKVRRYKSRGFTFLEVLLATTLITVVFTALLEAVSLGLFSGGVDESELVAVNLAQEKIEELRNTAYSGIANEARVQVSGFSAFERGVAVSTVQAGLKQVNVNVYWSAKANEINTSLVTYISDI